MSIRVAIFAVTLAGLLGSLLSVPVQAQTQRHPDCQSASSDTDGDGFGWENRTPCVITDATSTEPAAAMCVDDDGDGYGWDGSQVCRVDVMCYDTAPIGDGWGWDGSNSCEIASYDAPFSELQILKGLSRPGIRFGVEIPETIAICNVEDSIIRVRLLANGAAETQVNGGSTTRGLWSTGFEDSDGFLHMNGLPIRWLLITPNSVSSRDNGQARASDCFWE